MFTYVEKVKVHNNKKNKNRKKKKLRKAGE